MDRRRGPLARRHEVEDVPLRILEPPIGPEAAERNTDGAQCRLGCSNIGNPQRDMVWLPWRLVTLRLEQREM